MAEFVQAKAVAVVQWAENPGSAIVQESVDWHAPRAGGEGLVSAACGVAVQRHADSAAWDPDADNVCGVCVAQVRAGGGYARA